MKLEAKDIVGLVVTLIAFGTAYLQYTGKAKAEDERDILIAHQNKLIERYEKESKTYTDNLFRMDSMLNECMGAE